MEKNSSKDISRIHGRESHFTARNEVILAKRYSFTPSFRQNQAEVKLELTRFARLRTLIATLSHLENLEKGHSGIKWTTFLNLSLILIVSEVGHPAKETYLHTDTRRAAFHFLFSVLLIRLGQCFQRGNAID